MLIIADYTEIINLEDHKRGDKWYGVPKIGPILINEEQPSLPLSRIRMGFQSTMGETYIIDTETGVSATTHDTP